MQKKNGQRFKPLPFLFNKHGFSMIEVMVVVAIVGVLVAIAIPNFKKYQAKTRTAEAKNALAAAFTAESVFHEEYRIYHKCLSYMGFQPGVSQESRYYTVGFGSVSAIDSSAYNTATLDHLVSADCPNDTNLNQGSQIFIAGKTIGSAPVINSLQSASSEDGSGGTFLGTQSNNLNKTFVMAASGIIFEKVTDSSLSSLWTINQEKNMVQIRPGY